jgi:hypothetical protein
MMLGVATVAEPIKIKQISNESTSFNDDVPTWSVDDSWTYTINNFTVDYNAGDQKMFMDGKIDDFEWTVDGTSGSTYVVDFKGKLNAEYEISLSSSSMTLNVEGTFKPILTRLTGNIVLSKSDLEIEDIYAEIKGITMAKFFSIPIPLPIPFKLVIEGDLSTAMPVLDFPLSTLKTWALPDIDIEMNVQMGGIFGLIKIPISFQTHYPWTPLAFWCWNKESITVEAGIFDAWKISSIIGGFFEYYYAPSVGNLVKIDAALPNGNIRGELKSTNRL